MIKRKGSKMQTSKTKPNRKTEALYIRVSPEIREAIERAAIRDKRDTISDWVRVAILERLERDGG